MNTMTVLEKLKNYSVLALVVSNCLPLLGVLFWGWDTFTVILMYWSENVVIGFYHVLKMICAKGEVGPKAGSKVSIILFFIIHYGLFSAAHGLFVFALFSGNGNGGVDMTLIPMLLSFDKILCFACLLVSHGVSFVQNYIIKGEYKKTQLEKLAPTPYGRVVIMHLTVIFGGMASDFMGSPVWVLVILIVLKIIVDLKLHNREHKHM